MHDEALVAMIARVGAEGGGWLDADTAMNDASYDAALLAAGAGLTAVEALDAGAADSAFCAVRPPGHHATPTRSMGFCLFNNVAVTAAALAERGERVLDRRLRRPPRQRHPGHLLDRRARRLRLVPPVPAVPRLRRAPRGRRRRRARHHDQPPAPRGRHRRRVPRRRRRGAGARSRPRSTRPGCSSRPASTPIGPTPSPTSGCRRATTPTSRRRCSQLAPPGRRLVFLEGGYDLEALASSAAACVAAMLGERLVPEPPTSGGPGRERDRRGGPGAGRARRLRLKFRRLGVPM